MIMDNLQARLQNLKLKIYLFNSQVQVTGGADCNLFIKSYA